MISRIPAANGVETGASQESELGRVLDAYLAAIEAGQAIDSTGLAAAHPAIAGWILACLPVLRVAGQVEGMADAALELPADTCLGDFRILRVIGRGGMGIVFEAEQVSLKRNVALKVLPFAAALDPNQLRRFQIEAEAVAQLHHTNIVPIFSVGCERGVHFYAMQYIEGQTLAALIHDLRETAGLGVAPPVEAADSTVNLVEELVSGRLAPVLPPRPSSPPGRGTHRMWGVRARERVAEGRVRGPDCGRASSPRPSSAPRRGTHRMWGVRARERAAEGRVRGRRFPGSAYFRTVAHLGQQAAEALDHAHHLGIIHRDIKPANLLVDVRGNLWITDFGLARMQADSSLTMTGDIIGTLRYSSPEQATPERTVVDHRTDVYSLGATLYELLTLHPLHEGTDRAELLHNLALAESRPPRDWNPAIPRDLETIVLKALAKDVPSRYASALDLADDLRRFLEGRPIQARRPSLWKRALKWARRHKALTATTALLLLLVVSGAILTTAVSHNRQLSRNMRHLQYVQDIRQAFQLVRQGNPAAATGVLSRHRPTPGEYDNRSFPWYYLWRLCHLQPSQTAKQQIQGHEGDVYHVEYAPDGKTLASCGKDGTIRLWDPTTGQLLRFWRGHDGDANYVTFSPDGRMLATGGDDGLVRLWDTGTGKRLRTLGNHHDEVLCVLFTPDGRQVVSGGDGGILKSCEIATGREQIFPPVGWRIEGMALSPDGTTLVAAGWDHCAKVWDMATGKMKARIAVGSRVQSVAFSHNGRYLAIGCVNERVQVWDAQTSQLQNTFTGHKGRVQCVVFSPDDRMLASSSDDGKVRLWDRAPLFSPEVYQSSKLWTGDDFGGWCVAFSPDGRTLASCGRDARINLWDLSTRRDKLAIPRPWMNVRSMVFSTDSRQLRIFGWDTTIGWSIDVDTSNGKCRGLGTVDLRKWIYVDHRSHVAIGPRPSDRQRSPRHVGQTTASLSDFYAGLNRSIGASTPISTVIDPTGCAIARYVGAAISDVHDSTIRHGVLSPDGRMLATAAYDGIVTLWDAQTGLPLKGFFVQEATGFDADGKRTELPALAFSPTGRYLAVGGGRAGLVRWDTESGEKRFSLGFEVRDMGFLPNSNVILFSHASGFACWDAESGTLRQTGSDGPYGFNGVFPAFSADGRKIAAAQHDHSIGIWNASTLELDALLIGHGDAVTGLAWSPDGKILASAGADRTVRLWDISTGLELVILDDFAAEGMCEKLIFSPDGSILAGYGGRYYSPVILWQAPRDENSPTGRRPSNARSGVRNQASGSSTNPRTSSKSTGSIDVIAGVSSGGSPA